MHVKHTAGLDDMFNFETFGRSMILLFQISTSAGWDGVLAGLMNDQPPDCNATSTESKPMGDCGNGVMAIAYLVTYLVISFLVVINMYIAVILENFSQASEDVQQGITQDDFDMYYEIWEKYDEEATEYIPLDKLSEFVDALEQPLSLPLPNYYKLVSLNIPICNGEKVHCVDILDALTKNFLGTTGDPSELVDVHKGPERHDYEPISSTFKRQREIACARCIQRMWRDFVINNKIARGELDENGRPFLADGKTEEQYEKQHHTIVTIEEEGASEEEEDYEEKSKEDEESFRDKDEEDQGGKKRDRRTGAEDTPASTDDSRTVELYPESGVVA